MVYNWYIGRQIVKLFYNLTRYYVTNKPTKQLFVIILFDYAFGHKCSVLENKIYQESRFFKSLRTVMESSFPGRRSCIKWRLSSNIWNKIRKVVTYAVSHWHGNIVGPLWRQSVREGKWKTEMRCFHFRNYFNSIGHFANYKLSSRLKVPSSGEVWQSSVLFAACWLVLWRSDFTNN